MLSITTRDLLPCPYAHYKFVGCVAASLCRIVPADTGAVIGGRAFKDKDGRFVEAKVRVFDTADEALAFAAEVSVDVIT